MPLDFSHSLIVFNYIFHNARSEGFTTTADVARQTLLELGGTPLNPDDPVNRRRDYEMLTDERKGLSDWLVSGSF